MKNRSRLLMAMIAYMGLISFIPVFSQEVPVSEFSISADIYSSYIWRGCKYGTGPAIQPSIKYSKTFLTAGAWGSIDLSGYQETDLYFSFSLPAGLSMGLTDYYYPTLKYFDYSRTSGSHAFEINLGYSKDNLSLSANYIINEAGGAASLGGDKYFQAGYSFKSFHLFIGAGDGWHTYNPVIDRDKFAVCNLGLGTTKVIRVTDSFSIPVKGQLVFNPDKEQMHIVVGFTL
ncbi:MAG: hypothetical protein EPN88_08365 [Bacteroidetes bacterium]|nr:MAG: hypothetical protein EPN88_08365 [Bacteroidota bacterium]